MKTSSTRGEPLSTSRSAGERARSIFPPCPILISKLPLRQEEPLFAGVVVVVDHARENISRADGGRPSGGRTELPDAQDVACRVDNRRVYLEDDATRGVSPHAESGSSCSS
jgi:hypothetical protein